MDTLNIYGQSSEWEDACIKTRRSMEKRKKRIQKFALEKTDRVLDLGCGDGLNIKILNSMGIKNVVGIDISKELLKIAKKENPKAKFVPGSAEKIPFKSSHFDVIFVDSVFHHLLEYHTGVKEMYRVLKKGGLLCFIEPHQSIPRRVLDLLCELPVSKYIPRLKDRRVAYLGERRFMRHWLATENDFYKTLEKCKFKKVFAENDFLSIVAEYKK